MFHKHLDNMIKYAKVCNDLEKRDKHLDINKSKNGEFKVILCGIVIFLLLWWYYEANSTDMPIGIVLPFFIFVFGALAIYVRCLKNKKIELINENSSLMCFESDIVEIKSRRSRTRYGNERITSTHYFIRLQYDVEIEITHDEYYKFIKMGVRRVKVYFLEELLESFGSFEIEPMFDTIIQEETQNIVEESEDVGNKNLGRLIEKATTTNEYDVNNMIKYSISSYFWLLAFILITVCLVPYTINYPYSGSRPLLWIMIVLLLIPIYIFTGISKDTYKRNKLLKAIEKERKPLLVCECEIVKVFAQKQNDKEGWKLRYFLLLEDGIEIKIGEEQYQKIKDDNIKKVKIYFFEEMLIEYEEFEIEYL